MNGIVLGTGMGLDILVVIALHAKYGLNTQNGIHIGVLTTGLLTASPTGVTEDVDVGAPEAKLGVTRIIGSTLRNIKQLRVIVIGTVPVGTSLITYLREDIVNQLGIESRCHADGLRVNGVVALAHTMAGLTPPVVRGNAQTIDGDGLVHHQSYFLIGRQHAQ